MTLRRWLRRAEADFRDWDRRREFLLRESRQLVRSSGRLIGDLHRDLHRAASWKRLDADATGLLKAARARPEFLHAGFVQQALGEYAEARILESVLRGAPAPPPALGRLPGDALLLGVADAVGELRRALLDRLSGNDWKGAGRCFDQMESLFGLLRDADAPESLVALRPKRDAARGILERSRSDYVMAKKSKDLERKIGDVGSLLDEAEGVHVKKPKKAASDDLDLDGAWSKQ